MRLPRLRRRTQLAELDPLGRRIQACIARLEAADEIKPEPGSVAFPRFDGYCARAVRSYKLLAKHWPEARAEAWYAEALMERSPGDPGRAHFWLRLEDGRVLDLNHAPGENSSTFDYDRRVAANWGRLRKGGRFPQRATAYKIMVCVLRELGVPPSRIYPRPAVNPEGALGPSGIRR